MKTTQTNIRRAIAAVLCLVLLFLVCGCKPAASGLWKDAVYTADTTLGSGAKTVIADVTVDEKTVRFTVKTDAQTVGDALLDVGLIEGEEGPYGLYIKVVNGMTADYDKDQTYWAFYVNGEYGMTGVDLTPIAENEVYGFVRSK